LTGSLPLFVEQGDGRAVELVRAGGLLEQLAAALLLHGNAYVRLVADGHDRPAELFAMRPDRTSISCGPDGWPAAYVYRGGGQVARIARTDALGRRQVAHLKSLNPGDDIYGLGCLKAACPAASIHNRASRWNKALLDNAARPSGAMVYEPGDGSSLGGEQFDRLKAELADQFSGSANAGRPLLLDGGLKWQALGLSPADMDFVAVKEAAARDIALAFGVPPVLVGLPGDATYANAREAGRALYRQTILPRRAIGARTFQAVAPASRPARHGMGELEPPGWREFLPVQSGSACNDRPAWGCNRRNRQRRVTWRCRRSATARFPAAGQRGSHAASVGVPSSSTSRRLVDQSQLGFPKPPRMGLERRGWRSIRFVRGTLPGDGKRSGGSAGTGDGNSRHDRRCRRIACRGRPNRRDRGSDDRTNGNELAARHQPNNLKGSRWSTQRDSRFRSWPRANPRKNFSTTKPLSGSRA